MRNKRFVGIILVLALCVSLSTSALASDMGCVTLTVSDTQGVLLVLIEEGDGADAVYGLESANLCIPEGSFVDIAVLTEDGYYVEQWEVNVEGIKLNDPLTITEMIGAETIKIHTTWFIMPESAVSLEIQAVVSRSGQQAPQIPQTPGDQTGIPTRPDEEISVVVDGNRLDLEVPPYLLEGRTLVPLRAIFEALGADVIWDPEFQTIYAQKDDVAVGLMIGSNRMFRNGISSLIDVAPVIVGGRTLVPTRLIAESFGATVNWDPETRTVEIISYSS